MESILQHYGVKTTYLDVVDNVWVALWFALHQAKTKSINSHEYVYYTENENKYSFIVLLASDTIVPSGKQDGVYCGTRTSLVDLRKAVPSYFLRPHAPHAYMLRKNEKCPSDYSDLIFGIVQIPTDIGLKWLGTMSFLALEVYSLLLILIRVMRNCYMITLTRIKVQYSNMVQYKLFLINDENLTLFKANGVILVAEWHRIVEKLEELLPLCERLK